MGLLLKKFAKKEKVQETAVEHEEEKKAPFEVGEVKTDGIYQFTYRSDPITVRSGYRGEDETIIGYNYGWQIKCIDTTTPMKDIVMPDEFMGEPVIMANNCFENCYNVASVAHISKNCVESQRFLYGMFDFSGLREVPTELEGRYISHICGKAYAMPNYLQTAVEQYSEDADARKINELSNYLKLMQEKKDKELSLIDDEFSPYAKAEIISFVYNFHPTTVIRLQDHNENWYAVDMSNIGKTHADIMQPYDAHMKQFKSDGIQGLTVHSFEEVSLSTVKEILEIKFDDVIRKATEEKESHIVALNERIAEETAKADKAQEGLDFKPKKIAQTEISKDSKDEVTIGEE